MPFRATIHRFALTLPRRDSPLDTSAAEVYKPPSNILSA